MQKDMTAGSPAKAIVGFTIPVLIGNIFQQFYSMVDTIIVGKFVGTKALAAVGSVGTINFLIIGFMLGLTAGFTVLTAQRYGAGDMKKYEADRGVRGSAVPDGHRCHDHDQYVGHARAVKIHAHPGGYLLLTRISIL